PCEDVPLVGIARNEWRIRRVVCADEKPRRDTRGNEEGWSVRDLPFRRRARRKAMNEIEVQHAAAADPVRRNVVTAIEQRLCARCTWHDRQRNYERGGG